ncbi:MAG: copper-binding protein [Pseudomonadota bacterium]
MRALTLCIVAGLATNSLAFAESTADHSHKHGEHAAMKEGVHTKGTLHAINGDTVNLTHEPIPEIGWPQMTMDLKLLEGAEVGAVGPGDPITVMLEKGADGLYGIRALAPAE